MGGHYLLCTKGKKLIKVFFCLTGLTIGGFNYNLFVYFVEPECKVIAELLTEKQIDVFISFHSGGRYIMIPDYNSE